MLLRNTVALRKHNCTSAPPRRAQVPVAYATSRQALISVENSPAISVDNKYDRLGAYVVDETGRNPLAGDQELPLLDKRILVTAPRQYAQKLCTKLTAAGARALWVPGVRITSLQEAAHIEQLDSCLRAIVNGQAHGYTHIAFTSKNGVYAVMERLAVMTGTLDAGVDALKRSGLRLCALGADGEVLMALGLPLHVSPAEASTQGLVKELVQKGEAAGAAVLCPVPHVTGGLVEPAVVPRFLAALSDAGATPHRVPAYVTTLGTSVAACTAEMQLLQSGGLHAIAFSSTAEAQGLVQVMGGLPLFVGAVQRHDVLLAAHGPYTAEGVGRVLGLPVPCVSQNFKSFDGLVSALEGAFAGR
mmetsp:Transcript_6399/g.14237  ORF Transcript_6399/g.14237 Transcript_6399/m.14237 type:complete len:359 (-) Transcript_6399:803-1879(-)